MYQQGLQGAEFSTLASIKTLTGPYVLRFVEIDAARQPTFCTVCAQHTVCPPNNVRSTKHLILGKTNTVVPLSPYPPLGKLQLKHNTIEWSAKLLYCWNCHGQILLRQRDRPRCSPTGHNLAHWRIQRVGGVWNSHHVYTSSHGCASQCLLQKHTLRWGVHGRVLKTLVLNRQMKQPALGCMDECEWLGLGQCT